MGKVHQGRKANKTEVRCPRCEQIYIRYLVWPYTGRAKYPPYLCRNCRDLLRLKSAFTEEANLFANY